MADPRQVTPTLTSEEIFALVNNSQMAMGTSPSRRALRSTTGVTSSTSSPAEKPSAPPALPGKNSTKPILFDQIKGVDALDQPLQPAPHVTLPQLTTQATKTALQPSQPQLRNVCDWAQALPCEYPALPLLNK